MNDHQKNIETNIPEKPNTVTPPDDVPRKPGGLYRHVKMSVKTANILVVVCIVLLVACVGFALAHSGFTVNFDTNGGSHVESVKVMHGETVPAPEDPVKEGYTFTDWYMDRECTQTWDMETDTAVGDFTLYAGWSPNDKS